jgi:hypothetical protein
MRVIFLDIDGVLNSQATFCYHSQPEVLATLRPEWGVSLTWDPVLVSNYRLLLRFLPEDVKIVLSSSWRVGRNTLEEVKEMFDIRGVDSSRVIGCTPWLHLSGSTRGLEIQAWLDEHPEVTDFVILDDDSDMGKLRKKHLFKTEWYVGLTLPIVDKVLHRFGTELFPRKPALPLQEI